MAGPEVEILRLQFEVQGKQEVARAKAEIETLTLGVRKATEAFRANNLGQQAFAAQLAASQQQIAQHRATIDHWGVAAGKAQRNTSSLGMGIYQIGQIVEDSQYGFHGRWCRPAA